MEEVKVTLFLERSTKNKHLYKKEEDSKGPLDNVYVNKDAITGDAPESIVVTISEDQIMPSKATLVLSCTRIKNI